MIEAWQDFLEPKHKLLDVGCWDGDRIYQLRNKCDVRGVDIDTSKFKTAKKEIRDKLFFGDVTKKIPFKIKFDWIIFRDVLEHLEKDDEALKNISNSMKEGAYLIMSTPRHVPFLNWYDPAWIRWKLGGRERHKHYSYPELYKKLKKHSLQIEIYQIEGTIKWVFTRWLNGFFKYVLKSKKQITTPWKEGFFEWVIIVRKVSK